ncbi:MAG: glycosyltransferase family 2 protein [Opitutaceae bacterium]|nr:glycosyltransferase family 2 protein [Opitutaceae bacterium]
MSATVPALSLVVPAFNEEELFDHCMRTLHGCGAQLGLLIEIVIVDDGSTDRTPQVADTLARELPRVAACHQPNQGIGGAFRTGTQEATGEYLMLWPADMPAAPEDLAPFAALFGHADVIVGVRRRRIGYNPLMRFNAWLYPHIVRWLFGLRLRDVKWIQAYRREKFAQIQLRSRASRCWWRRWCVSVMPGPPLPRSTSR